MNKRFILAIRLATYLVLISSGIIGILTLIFFGSLNPIIDILVYLLIGQAIFFVASIAVIQIRIENFLYTRMKSLYQELFPTGVVLKEDSLKRDVLSITRSMQESAEESKLEIELLKDKENYRKEFIGNLAHELKTPLFTVQGYIYTLLEGEVKDNKMRKKYLKKAANGVDRLGFIVNDLDLITQFETGGTSLNVESFDLVGLILDMIELLEIQAEKSNVKLMCALDRETPIKVLGDMERISQVLTNLVINSFKYGVNDGTTEIEVGELNAEKVLVRVIDNGRGISEEHLPRLFERFYRVDKTRNRNEGGSGLGLAIVKHIIEAHNEQIYVESTLNVGSEFSFTLSRAPATEA